MGKGTAKCAFVATKVAHIKPRRGLAETKIPDATPSIVAMYRLSDEQALLASLRYNRLIDVFTGATCYSLQNHLRTQVKGIGQVETDELYIGVDKRGVHRVFPIQPKGGADRRNIVQVMQDVDLCRAKFPSAVCRPLGAQFVATDLIALFELEEGAGSFSIAAEKHYRLVPPEEITETDLAIYRKRPE